MAQESKLLITVDSRKAKTELDSVDKSLKSVEMQGDKTAKKSKDLGGAFKQAGDAAKSAKDGVSSFDGSLGGLTKTLGSSSALLSSAAIGIAGVAGAAVGSLGALTGMALAYSNNAKEIQNLATVADMGVVEFQRMAVAAQQVGITQEQLSDQIKDFNEKLGEFVLTGKGEATDAFELLQKHSKMSGEEIKKFALEMQKASGGDAMQMYVNKLEEAGVSQEQMSFLTENMANDFTKLLPIFADNGAAIEEWGNAAERAGFIITEQGIETAIDFSAQAQLLELQLKGMSNTMLAAVVPALVDIADAFFQDSEQGSTFAQVGDTLAVTLKVLASTAIVVGNAFYLVGDAIGAGAAAMMRFLSGDFAGAAQIVKDNYTNAVDSVANSMEKIDKIFTGKTANNVKNLKVPPPKDTPRKGITTGLDDFAAGEKEKTKKAKSEGDKRKREAERLAKEIARIEYEYATADQQRRMKLNDEIEYLQEKGMSKYIDDAQDRYNQEEKLIQMKFEFELAEHLMTEEQKLRFSMNIREQEIKADHDLTKEQKALKKSSLDEQFKQELELIKLTQEQRIFAANEFQYAEIDRIKKRYELERREIDRNRKLSSDERHELMVASYMREGQDTAYAQQGAAQNFLGAIGVDYSAEAALQNRMNAIIEYREWFTMSEAQFTAETLAAQSQFERDKQDLALSSLNVLLSATSSTWSNMTQMIKEKSGEQSGAYKTMFAMQQAFSVTSATINALLAYNQVLASPWTFDPISKQLAASITLGMGMANVGLIAGQTIAGMAHDGIDNIPKEGTWLLDKGERVVDSRTNGDLKQYLANRQSDGPKITINNNASVDVSARQNSDGTLTIDVVERFIADSLSQPNSKIRKSLNRNTTATARR
ncbi:phage tail tape measure protein [Acinetobacter sp.]|uniref:phage tail tape measure protein n=1 Tax=Acinetobacter sp. TaxID=472 RepID=UPI0028B19268|nr:phage tail tape measure protein [Acinetobacter sp.]